MFISVGTGLLSINGILVATAAAAAVAYMNDDIIFEVTCID